MAARTNAEAAERSDGDAVTAISATLAAPVARVEGEEDLVDDHVSVFLPLFVKDDPETKHLYSALRMYIRLALHVAHADGSWTRPRRQQKRGKSAVTP